MKNLKKLIFPLLLGLLILGGCSKKDPAMGEVKEKEEKNIASTEDQASSEKKTIYVSVYPYYDFTKSIVGDKMEVLDITKGQGFHHWEPTAKDLADIQNASLFIYSGPGLETWADKLIENGSISGNILAVSDGLDLLKATHDHDHEDEEEGHDHEDEEDHDHEEAHDHEEEDHDHDHGIYDPHIWLSLKNAQIILENIKDKLVEIDPENEATYQENFEKTLNSYKALDEKYEDTLAKRKRSTIVVSHEAYGYLCRDYGFDQVGIEGINAQGEPSLKQIAEIIEVSKENDVKVIFYEESISPKVADLIAKEVGADLVLLSPIEVLSQDQKDQGKDYLSIMEDNLGGLEKALNE